MSKQNYPAIMFSSKLAGEIGLNETLFITQLNQIIDLSKKEEITYTKKQWKDNFFPFWSEKTIERTYKRLEQKGLINIRKEFNMESGQRNHFSINKIEFKNTLGGI